MAARARRKGSKLDWQGMTDEQRGLALLAVYRRAEFADGEPFEFDGEPGVLWRKLNIRSLITFATELTGLGVGPINDAHKWMRDNGFRHKDGSGTAVKHYILMAPPAGSNPEGSADEVADTLAAAMDTITRLTTENDLLKEENHRLRTERNPSSDAPPGTRITGLARQLQSMIDSE